MKFYTKEEAKQKGADIQLTLWHTDNLDERAFIQKMIDHILKYTPNRKTAPVQKGGLIALFVDNIAKIGIDTRENKKPR